MSEALSDRPDKNRNIRIVLPPELYDKVKLMCPEHGQLSQLVRKLLSNHIKNLVEE